MLLTPIAEVMARWWYRIGIASGKGSEERNVLFALLSALVLGYVRFTWYGDADAS